MLYLYDHNNVEISLIKNLYLFDSLLLDIRSKIVFFYLFNNKILLICLYIYIYIKL